MENVYMKYWSCLREGREGLLLACLFIINFGYLGLYSCSPSNVSQSASVRSISSNVVVEEKRGVNEMDRLLKVVRESKSPLRVVLLTVIVGQKSDPTYHKSVRPSSLRRILLMANAVSCHCEHPFSGPKPSSTRRAPPMSFPTLHHWPP